MLTQMGCEVVGEAKTGNDAVDLCRKLNPDLLIINAKLPELNGFEAYKAIQSKNMVNSALFIVDDEVNETELKGNTIEHFIKKPFVFSEFQFNVEKALKRDQNNKPDSGSNEVEDEIPLTSDDIQIIIPSNQSTLQSTKENKEVEVCLSIPKHLKFSPNTPNSVSFLNTSIELDLENEQQKISIQQKTSKVDGNLNFGVDFFNKLKSLNTNESYCEKESYCDSGKIDQINEDFIEEKEVVLEENGENDDLDELVFEIESDNDLDEDDSNDDDLFLGEIEIDLGEIS